MTTPRLYLRTAVPDDLETLLGWRREAAQWISGRHGSSQWSTPVDRRRLLGWIDEGHTFMAALTPDGPPIATITSTPDGSPRLWTAEERRTPAHYLRKLVVARSHCGLGIGVCLGRWSRTHAARAGARLVRFNVWATNARLLDYYRDQGARLVRRTEGTHPEALFEHDARVFDGLPVIEASDIAAG